MKSGWRFSMKTALSGDGMRHLESLVDEPVTSPARSASTASIMRPVTMRSMAQASPIARASHRVPPVPAMEPSLSEPCAVGDGDVL